MLVCLDNYISFGPRSRIVQDHKLGLNENLAREAFELHTLGVKGGYGQNDVVALAKIISGWSAAGHREDSSGHYRYHPLGHEPGTKTLLGKTYAEDGENEGKAALADLARHPATASFIALKLARHFIADDPMPPTVTRLAGVFRATDGDLRALALAVIDAPEAWETPLAKLRTPNHLVISTFRSFNPRRVEDNPLIGALNELGQFPFSAPSPAGWPDRSQDWLAPEALMRRIEWAHAVAERLPPPAQPTRWADKVMGPAVSKPSRALIAQAESAREALALGLAGP